MKQRTAWEMYNLLTEQHIVVSVFVKESDGATEITSIIERCGKYSLDDYELVETVINPYSDAECMLATMYVKERRYYNICGRKSRKENKA